MARRRKTLSGEDLALWAEVAKSVTPLEGRGTPPPSQKSARRRKAAGFVSAPQPALPALPALDGGETPPPASSIERKRLRQLAKGRQAIDSRIDLHGMTQEEAHRRLTAHLAAAVRRGERCVLVITGKGGPRMPQGGGADRVPAQFRRRSDFGFGAGVLRRAVPLWLDSPELRPLVSAFAPAHERHGGEGALYVMLRRIG